MVSVQEQALSELSGKPRYFLYGFITNQHNDKLHVGFLVQLLKHCSSIAEVMDLNTAQA